MKYTCELCGMIYDEARGDPKRGIPAGTAFAALPHDYTCPVCGSEQEAYSPQGQKVQTSRSRPASDTFWRDVKYGSEHHDSER